jgi:hypothetical protein
MRKKTATALTVLAAAGSLVAIGATPASAATWTINPAGNDTGTSVGSVTLTDTTHSPPTVLTCTSSTANANVPSAGSGKPGTNIAKITSLAFSSCTGPLSITFTVASSGLPWFFDAGSYNSGTHVTTGVLHGVHAHLSGPLCSADVDGTSATANNGTVNGTYTNPVSPSKTGKLAITGTGTLKMYNVSGCFGLIANGHNASFVGTYNVNPSPTSNPGLVLTSP